MLKPNLDTVKQVVGFGVGASVGKVTADIISNNTNPATVQDTAKVYVGAFVIGAMARDASTKYVNTKIDELAAWYESRKTQS